MLTVRKSDIKWIIIGGVAIIALVVLLILLLTTGTPAPMGTPTPTPYATPVYTATPEPTPVATPTATPEPTPTPTPTPVPKTYMAVNVDKLNLRSEPNTSSSVLTGLTRGTIVEVVDMQVADGWYKVVTTSGQAGYCSAEFLVASAAPTPTPAPTFMKVKADTLNLRKTPSTSADVLTGLARDTVVKLITSADADGWCKIELKDGTTGYCKYEYLLTGPTGW